MERKANQEQQKQRPNKQFLIAFPLLILGLVGIDFGMSRIEVVTSPSIPYRVFFLGEPDPKKDGYVYFHWKDSFADNFITKIVACTPGEELIVKGRDYYCGLRPLGTAKEYSKKGVKLNQFVFSGKIPEDKYYVAGTFIDSYDSRYFGFIDKKDIIASAYPIF